MKTLNSRCDFLKLAGTGVLLFPMPGKTAGSGFQPLEKPNIVFFLREGPGYGDSCKTKSVAAEHPDILKQRLELMKAQHTPSPEFLLEALDR